MVEEMCFIVYLNCRSEYVRLEREFRATLEKLRTRMEAAYSVKEREVEVRVLATSVMW